MRWGRPGTFVSPCKVHFLKSNLGAECQLKDVVRSCPEGRRAYCFILGLRAEQSKMRNGKLTSLEFDMKKLAALVIME